MSEDDDTPEQTDSDPSDQAVERRRLARLRRREREVVDREGVDHEARFVARLAHQWSQLREERYADPRGAGPSLATHTGTVTGVKAAPAGVPWGYDLAASFAWRFLVIVASGYLIVQALSRLSEVTVPLAIALLIAALTSPVVRGLTRIGMPRGLASLLTVLLTFGFIVGLLTLATQQIATGADDLANSTADGLGKIRTWLKDGPLHASDSQINEQIQRAQDAINKQVAEGDIAGRVTEVGATISHVFTGLFIVLFSTYFFLADGNRIWSWLVRLSPRAARARVDSSGRVAWISLTQFVRATVIVAATDALGVAVGAAVLGVPFVFPIGVVVFLGAFVPLIGAFVAGGVAVLVALVANGPVVALLMLAVIVVVQQIESHVLQPFLMGRWVSIHPLGVIVAIAVGIILAGVTGALIAVPLAAVANAVITHLAAFTGPGADPEEELAEDYAEGDSVEPLEDQSEAHRDTTEDNLGDKIGADFGDSVVDPSPVDHG